MAKAKTKQQLAVENEELQARLQELEDTLEAIRSGSVDAIVTSGPAGDRVFTLEGADHAYHTMVESMNEGAVTVLPEDGTILYANRQFGQMTGASPSEIVGRSFRDFVQASDRPIWSGFIRQEGSDGLKAEIRLGNQSADGIPVQISSTPIDLRGTKALALVVTDLSDRRRYEEIVTAERLSRYILEQSLEGVAVCVDGRILFASRRLHEIYGGNPLMQPFDRLFPLRMSERETFSVEIPQSGQVVKSAEVSYQNPDGVSYSLILNAGPLYGDEHRILGCLVSLTDITERKRAEDSLRASEERFRNFSSMASEGIMIHDSGVIVDANPAFANLLGFTCPSDLIGKRGVEAIRLTEPSMEILLDHLRTGAADAYEVELVQPDGTLVPCETSGRDIVWNGRKARLVYMRDITERKRAEKDLQRNEARFRLLSTTAGRLLATDDPQGLVKDLCRDVMEYLDCQAFFNFMVDERAGRLRLNACTGIPVEEVRKLEWLDYGVAVCGCVARDGARIVAEDIFHTPDARTELVRSYGIQAYCCHPLKVRDRLIGTLSFGTKTRARFTPEEVELMRIVADQVAVAMQRIQAQQEIVESNQRLQLALDAGGMGMWAWDLQTNRTLWSSKEYELLGLPAGNGAVDAEVFFRYVHPEDAPDLRGAVGDVVAHGSTFEREFRIVRADGQIRWLSSVGRVMRAESGQPLSLIGINYDFTERKEKEEEFQRLNRTLRALSSSSHALMRAEEENAYLEEVCRIVVRDCGYAMVWIGYAEDNEDKTVRPVAHAGFEDGYLATLDLTWADTERGRGPTGTAIRTGKPSMCTNMLTDPRFSPWREEALKRGYASSLVLPLLAGAMSIGALTIYSKHPDPFSENEVKLLTELADDLTQGITTLRLRRQARQAQQALQQSRDELEEKVRERTSELILLLEDLEKSRDDLRKLASELVMTEERERKRIAVTLHDEVAQTLAAAKMRLDLLRKVTEGQASSEVVDEARDLLMQSIRETRALMTDISSPILYEMGLPAAVQNLAEQTSASYGLTVSHDVTGEFGNLGQETNRHDLPGGEGASAQRFKTQPGPERECPGHRGRYRRQGDRCR